jgi:DNA-binding IscR family transcriptional regulator
MAGLRDTGYVRSEKGHGGGWVIACPLERVSLLDIHRAVGGPKIFAIGNEHSDPECAVEQLVNEAVEDALRDAEALLVERLPSWPRVLNRFPADQRNNGSRGISAENVRPDG